MAVDRAARDRPASPANNSPTSLAARLMSSGASGRTALSGGADQPAVIDDFSVRTAEW